MIRLTFMFLLFLAMAEFLVSVLGDGITNAATHKVVPPASDLTVPQAISVRRHGTGRQDSTVVPPRSLYQYQQQQQQQGDGEGEGDEYTVYYNGEGDEAEEVDYEALMEDEDYQQWKENYQQWEESQMTDEEREAAEEYQAQQQEYADQLQQQYDEQQEAYEYQQQAEMWQEAEMYQKYKEYKQGQMEDGQMDESNLDYYGYGGDNESSNNSLMSKAARNSNRNIMAAVGTSMLLIGAAVGFAAATLINRQKKNKKGCKSKSQPLVENPRANMA